MLVRFEDILSTAKGKDDAFEELTCQLARRSPPEKAVEFRRIHGAGGDGGVEAYWVLDDGTEVGYQAKYYLKSGAVRWEAIDESVDTALNLHPQLRKYYVAIACDLTDKTARGGKSGWEKWQEHKKRWASLAKSRLGHEVDFVAWSAFELRAMLELPRMAGLLEHWFGDLGLRPDWLSHRVDRAVADLDERYHAEDHVPVGIEQLFDVVVRSGKIRDLFRARLTHLKESANRWLWGAPGIPSSRAGEAKRALDDVANVLSLQAGFDVALWTPWEANRWASVASIAQGSVSVLATLIQDEIRRAGRVADQDERDLLTGLGQVISHLVALNKSWSSALMQAERDRAVLLEGRGGSGKSHLLADQARRGIAEGRPVVLVLGQHLRAGAIWPQVLERLGVIGTPPETFLQALDSTGEATGKRALFLVDALNEGVGAPLWKNELASFLATFKPFTNIVCVLSCRSEYLTFVVPPGVAKTLAKVTVRGFVTEQEQRQAASVYMDRNGISRPSSPWLAEEFRKPPYVEASIDLTKVRELTLSAEQGMSRGAQRIVSSCLHLGDFGDYAIKQTVREVTTVSVAALPIVTKESAFRNFRSTVLGDKMDRVAAFHKLEEHLRMMRMPQMTTDESKLVFKSKSPSKAELAQAELLEGRLLALLSPEEVQSFREEAVPWLNDSHSEQAERVDVMRCQTWVARRAIELGGLAIEVDRHHSTPTSDRPVVERLSKKYQWLALSELLCGLGSTLCLESGWQENRTLRPYDFPTDFGFVRDIDPTVLSHDPGPTAKAGDAWMFGEPIILEEVSEADLSAWPARNDPGKGFDKKVVRVGDDGQRWFVLYDHTHKTEQYLQKSVEHGMRQQEFRRIFSVFVETSRLEEFIDALKEDQDINVSNWEVPQLTDGPYLGEIFWRATAPREQWSDRGFRVPPSIRLAYPVCQYLWESHLDLSFAEGARAYLPAPWLTNKLNWTVLPSAADTLVDAMGLSVLIRKSTEQDNVVLLSETALKQLRREAGLSCVWLLVAERNAWPGGSNAAATWRRAEGMAWMNGSRVVSSTWTRDGSAQEVEKGSRTGTRRRRGKLGC